MSKIIKNNISYAGVEDNKVKQNETSTNASYEVLLSGTADNTTRSEEVRKSEGLTYNPDSETLSVNHESSGTVSPTISLDGSTGAITATSLNGSAIGSSPAFTDNKVTQTNTTSAAYYRVLLSSTNDNTDRTDGVNKSSKLEFNPAVSSGAYVGFMFKDGTRGDWITDQVCGLLDIAGFNNINVRLCGDGTVAAEKIICHSMYTYDISDQYTITKTSGNWKVTKIDAVRSGNTIHMRIEMSGNGSSVSAGSNGFVGTLSGGPLPALSVKLIAYYNNCPILMNIEPGGGITARVTATSVTVTTTGSMALTGTFITNN